MRQGRFDTVMYRPILSQRDRAMTLSGVVLIHLALAFALLTLTQAPRTPPHEELIQLIDVAARPVPPMVEIVSRTPRSKREEGSASAANLESQATPVVAPKPVIEVPSPQPILASPTPALGLRVEQGASDVVGPGTGAGGSGTGTGSGGAGAGDGGGGSGIASRASLMTPSLRSRDYPADLRNSWPRGGGAFVMFTVQPNGRVTNCRIYRSSGSAVIDMVTCSLVTARFVYRPAYNQRGEPVASQMAYEQRD